MSGKRLSATDLAQVRQFLVIVEDFGRLSTGPFKTKYPDYQSYEGYEYIARKGRALARDLQPERSK